MTLAELDDHLANRRSVSIRGRYRSDPAEVIRITRAQVQGGWVTYVVFFWGEDGWTEGTRGFVSEVECWLENGSARVVPPDLDAIEEAQALQRAQDDDARGHP